MALSKKSQRVFGFKLKLKISLIKKDVVVARRKSAKDLIIK